MKMISLNRDSRKLKDMSIELSNAPYSNRCTLFEKMKPTIYIFFIIFFASCNFNEKPFGSDYGKQELELLNGYIEYTTTFNFKLTKERQFQMVISLDYASLLISPSPSQFEIEPEEEN